MTFVTDLDGNMNINVGTGNRRDVNIFAYPGCRSNYALANGDAGNLFPPEEDGALTPAGLRQALSDGDTLNFERLTSTPNNENFPLIFEFINDPIGDSFTFKFSSPTFQSAPLECVYNSAVNPDQDFIAGVSPDGGGGDEVIRISSITITKYVIISNYL